MKINQFIILSFLISAIGFIPWESFLSIEIRSDLLNTLLGGTLALGGLLCMVGGLLIKIMRYDKWYSGLAMLGLPILMIPISFFMLFSIFAVPEWKDQAVYKNGDNYLVVEGIYYGRDAMEMDYRIIATTSPRNNILRRIEIIKPSNYQQITELPKQVEYQNKTWAKQVINH